MNPLVKFLECRKRTSVIAALIIVVAVSGCVNVSYTSLVPETFAQGSRDPEVLMTVPNRPFALIGLLQADGAAGTNHPQLIDSIKAKAKEQGANAVYILSFQEKQTPKGIMYNPYLGGYQTIGGFNVPRVYALALRYKEGNASESKQVEGQWIGQGVSTTTGNFTIAVTFAENYGGISGVFTSSSGLSGTVGGYMKDNSLELLVVPSDIQKYCILKFVGSFNGKDAIKGQYSSVLCSGNEGGLMEMSRPKPSAAPQEQKEQEGVRDKVKM